MSGRYQQFLEWMKRVRQNWPPARVLKWSRILSRGGLWASPLFFCTAVALSIHGDNEARRLYPDEPIYDVPTDETLLLMGLAFLSLVLAAVFSVVGSMAKAHLFRNPR